MEINLRCPKYLKDFKCIGGKCSDSCCIGWDVDIDKSSFREYYKVKDQELKKMFQKNLYNNDNYSSDNIDYGKMKLKSQKRCPFLDDDNYCIIHSKLGEGYLSNVCTSFPRILNIVDGVYEMTLDVSCPEAARMILLNEEGIALEYNKIILGKHIVSSEINTKNKECKGTPLMYYNEILEKSIEIIKDRNYVIEQRLYMLGQFIDELSDELINNFDYVLSFIHNYKWYYEVDDYFDSKINYVLRTDFFKNIITKFNIFDEIDSDYFKKYTEEVIEGYRFKEVEALGKNAQFYIDAYEEYTEKYLSDNDYIFENYLVNFMYNYMFPFSESENIFEGYIMLVVRYAFIKFYLVGRYLTNKEESNDNIVRLIQGFSKCIGHHYDYLTRVLGNIKVNEFDNMEFIKMLLI